MVLHHGFHELIALLIGYVIKHSLVILVPRCKLGINDSVLLAEGDYRNTTCLGLLVVKFQYPFKIFTACHNRIFMFCSTKVTWFMQNASEAIECLPIYRQFYNCLYIELLKIYLFIEYFIHFLRSAKKTTIHYTHLSKLSGYILWYLSVI